MWSWIGIRVGLLGLLLYSGIALGQSGEMEAWFKAGNDFYAQGNFQAASSQYQKIVQAGAANEWVYYNLGNACFKQNQVGLAILYYEKAWRLAPQEREIGENLELARHRLVDKVEAPAENAGWRLLRRVFTFLSINRETLLAAAAFVFANVFLAFLLLRKWQRFRLAWFSAALVGAGLFLIFTSSNAIRIYQTLHQREAIVLVEKVDVLSGPGRDNSTLFSIHEGLKVQVRNQLGDWVQISLENGWNGWMRMEDVGLI